MKRGEMEEAMETFNFAVSTLAVWDLGQGIVYPVAQKLINKIVLKYQDDFRNTLQAFREYRSILKTDVLDDATKAANSNVLKGKLLEGKGRISQAFQKDVKIGLSGKFKNTQIYADMVTDLKGIKTWAKAAKWADVFAGPLFDAATVAVSAWQLAEAIKSKDEMAISSSALGLASGLAGITGFAVAALATAGSTIAAVAGPIGAVVGAVLGIASIIVEIIASINPYNEINQHIDMIKTLTENSKKLLDADKENLNNLVPSRTDFIFSWVFEVNQGLLLEYVRGRWDEYYEPVKFRLKVPPKEEGGYMTIGEMKYLDKGKYPDNVFWNPSGLVDLGYDFYGKKLTEEFKGATVLVSTDMLAGKPDVVLKGTDIETFNAEHPDLPDNVVIGDMYDISPRHLLEIKTGGGDDVIQINGLLGKRKHPRAYLQVCAVAKNTLEFERKESNVLSFEGMSGKEQYDYGLIGVKYSLRSGRLHYRIGSGASHQRKDFGQVTGIKMFVGSSYNDSVTASMDEDYVIRETKGINGYVLETTSWRMFKITIDDQAEVPGNLNIMKTHSFAGVVRSSHLVWSEDTQTLFIYGKQRKDTGERWQLRGRIFFNRRRDGYPLIRTDVDGVVKRLNEFPHAFNPPGGEGSVRSGVDYQYYFDQSLISSDCGSLKVYLTPPDFQTGKYRFYFYKRKNVNDFLIMKADFVTKCIKQAEKSITLIRGTYRVWLLRLVAPGGFESSVCLGKDFELDMDDFEKLLEQRSDGSTRLVVDLYRDRRPQIDVATELKKLDNRQNYYFDKDVDGNLGIPQVVLLKTPKNRNPSQTATFNINMKGGQRLNEDSLIFTEELRKWLKRNNRKAILTKKPKGVWKLEIKKPDGAATHRVNLKNIERIDYETTDGSLRQPVVEDLATETETKVNLAVVTKKWLKWNRPMYSYNHLDCKNTK